VAELLDTPAYMTDKPDFWRREHTHYQEHSGRFTGEPAYEKHLYSAAREMMEKANKKPQDFDYVVFHQPNGKFPANAVKRRGFTEAQYNKFRLLCPTLGAFLMGANILLASGVIVGKILINVD